MTVYKTLCKDSKTGYRMVASGLSFNEATKWLENELKEENSEIIGIALNGAMYTIHTQPFVDMLTEEEAKWVTITDFFYDEERGYLLAE